MNRRQSARAALAFGLFAAAIIGLAGPATADTRETSYTLAPNEQSVVGRFYEIKTETCGILPRPTVTITEPPQRGRLFIEAVEHAPRQEKCSHLRVPTAQVVYEAGTEAGNDRFAFSVAYKSRNLGTWHRIGIVTIAGAPAAGTADSPYETAIPALRQAGGDATCVSCFLQRYAPAEFNKAFAVSRDGAYGARWSSGISVEEARRAALESCRQKPEYNPANPCVVFFENDQLIWQP